MKLIPKYIDLVYFELVNRIYRDIWESAINKLVPKILQ